MVGDQDAIGEVAAFTNLWTQRCTDVGAAIVRLHHTGKPDRWRAGAMAVNPSRWRGDQATS